MKELDLINNKVKEFDSVKRLQKNKDVNILDKRAFIVTLNEFWQTYSTNESNTTTIVIEKKKDDESL